MLSTIIPQPFQSHETRTPIEFLPQEHTHEHTHELSGATGGFFYLDHCGPNVIIQGSPAPLAMELHVENGLSHRVLELLNTNVELIFGLLLLVLVFADSIN